MSGVRVRSGGSNRHIRPPALLKEVHKCASRLIGVHTGWVLGSGVFIGDRARVVVVGLGAFSRRLRGVFTTLGRGRGSGGLAIISVGGGSARVRGARVVLGVVVVGMVVRVGACGSVTVALDTGGVEPELVFDPLALDGVVVDGIAVDAAASVFFVDTEVGPIDRCPGIGDVDGAGIGFPVENGEPTIIGGVVFVEDVRDVVVARGEASGELASAKTIFRADAAGEFGGGDGVDEAGGVGFDDME